MTKPSPGQRRGELPAIQIRPSNELAETLIDQIVLRGFGSANRTLVMIYIEILLSGLCVLGDLCVEMIVSIL